MTVPSNQAIITYIDSFGNIKTNKSWQSIPASKELSISINGNSYSVPMVKTFKNVPIGSLLGYKGSNNTLEIAVNQGSAPKDLMRKWAISYS